MGIVGADGDPHEEHWVMDHEGFGGLLGGECGVSEAARLAEAIERVKTAGYAVEAVSAWRDHVGAEYADLDDLSDFEESFCGEYGSEEEYAEELAEELELVPEEMPWPLSCIDWERAANELFSSDYFSTEAPGGVYVFRCC